jgi:hypothetical protein
VIVSPVDGLTEQVEGCGPLATAPTEEGLADALRQLLGSTPEEREAWSRAARASARDSWQVYLDAWQALLAEPR